MSLLPLLYQPAPININNINNSINKYQIYFDIFILCTYMYACMSVCHLCVGDQKRASDALEMVLSYRWL